MVRFSSDAVIIILNHLGVVTVNFSSITYDVLYIAPIILVLSLFKNNVLQRQSLELFDLLS